MKNAPEKKKNYVRKGFDFSKEAYNRLNEMQKDLKLKNKAEVFRQALSEYSQYLNLKDTTSPYSDTVFTKKSENKDSTNKPTNRIIVDFSKEAWQDFCTMKKRIKAIDNATVLRQALAHLDQEMLTS